MLTLHPETVECRERVHSSGWVRRTVNWRLAGVIAFYPALWPFGWIETVWVASMLPPLLLLLRAERRAAAAPAAHIAEKPRADVRS